ncbi:unnamed protein product [Owenia fusiformis]|uniref:Uncharacterized protein n=1 Tax=Owenia fusiformis TaxID=6347 RepID=A0A8S4NLW0_OWEFU|nr:unnamed protein product [Owenia fusiformis]
MFKICKNMAPDYIIELFDRYKSEPRRVLRTHRPFQIPAKSSTRLNKAPVLRLISEWNRLSPEDRSIPTISMFKSKIKNKTLKFTDFNTTSKLNLSRKQEIILNRIRCGLYFESQKFAHNFPNTSNLCVCGKSAAQKHLILHCKRHSTQRKRLEESLEQYNLWTPLNGQEKIESLIFQNSLSLGKDSDLKEKFVEFVSTIT